MVNGSQITEQDRAEATCVTSRGSGHLFEIQLGHLCNNRCVFCSSGQLTELKIARHIPLDPIISAIESARASGARRITFLGGEPTLHKGFLSALKRSVELGFESIVIFTNGVLLPHPGFIEKVVALGKFEWRISIQGANEDAHVAVTGRKDSFRRIVQGLEKLRALGQDVTANICINEYSYRSLPEFPALVAKHGIRQLHLDIVRPSSAGERTVDYLREIMPRYSTMAPQLREMLATFDSETPDYDVNIGNMPFCILPEFAHRINHGGEETVTQSCDDTALEVAVDKYEWHASMRRHVPACAGCVFRSECTGIFSTYLDIHGADEFQAVTLDDLRGPHADSHHFTLMAEPVLAPLKASALPEGWRLESWSADRRGRHIEARFRDVRDGRVEFRFIPPRTIATQPVVMKSDTFQLSIVADTSVSATDLGRLLASANDVLRGTIHVAAFVADHTNARAMERGRSRVSELVERIELHGPFESWTLARRNDGPEGSTVEVRGPAGEAIELTFTIRPETGHPRVTMDARVARGTNAAVANSAVQQLVRTLRANAPDSKSP